VIWLLLEFALWWVAASIVVAAVLCGAITLFPAQRYEEEGDE
jgi:hypothetical protein